VEGADWQKLPIRALYILFMESHNQTHQQQTNHTYTEDYQKTYHYSKSSA
jgi:hypothetical protein